MAEWKPDRLLKLLLIWAAIPMVAVWLPVIRAPFDGASYSWPGGRGVTAAYWGWLALAVCCIALLYLGWRGARRPFHWILLAWNGFLAGAATWGAITEPDAMVFQGDTLGVRFSLMWAGPAFCIPVFLMSLWWVARDLRGRKPRTQPAWNRRNSVLLGIAIGLLPLQFYLLHYGPHLSQMDQIGVILTMAQWAMLNLAFVPWQAKAAKSLPQPSRG